MLKIITISGVDGSGKSTQVKLLTEYLREQGARVFYFHAVEFSLAKKIAGLKKYCLLCRLLGRCKIQDKKEEKSITSANAFQIALRKVFLRIDIWRFRNLLVRLEKQGYDYVLSDRYFYDSMVNIEFLSKPHPRLPRPGTGGQANPLLRKERELELPIGLKPHKSFYLSVLPETIMTRERVPDQGLDYLIEKQKIFQGKLKEWDMLEIDGNGSVEEVFDEIVESL